MGRIFQLHRLAGKILAAVLELEALEFAAFHPRTILGSHI